MRYQSLLTCVLVLMATNVFGQAVGQATVRYSAGMPESAAAVVAAYGSIPKGVVLEDAAQGFEELKVVTYNKDKNEFTINGTTTYRNPVTRREFGQIFGALRKDDRMGVTLHAGEPNVFGPLSAESDIVKQMVVVDNMLGGIALGLERQLEGVKLPCGYRPKRATDRKIPVIAFTRFAGYVFAKTGASYTRSSLAIDVQLIPLSEQKTAAGGQLPDHQLAKEYVIEPTDQENLDHLKTHQAEYLQIPAFAKTAAAGEAAAFARLVRDSKIDAEEFQKLLNK